MRQTLDDESNPGVASEAKQSLFSAEITLSPKPVLSPVEGAPRNDTLTFTLLEFCPAILSKGNHCFDKPALGLSKGEQHGTGF